MSAIDPAVLATALAHAQRRIADLEAQVADWEKRGERMNRDVERYREYWLEERGNIVKLARIGDKLRRVDAMALCPVTDEWDKACMDFGVDDKEDDNG